MYLVMPVVILSGLIFLYPQFAPATLFGLDGLLPVALVHYLGAAVILLFMVSHIYLGHHGPQGLQPVQDDVHRLVRALSHRSRFPKPINHPQGELR
jgi:thiosulfate reductase cytochrome b subunit